MSDAGADDGRLTPCPASPNCVCSDDDGASHGIAPLAAGQNLDAAWAALLDYLSGHRGFRIVAQRDDYIHAEARTRLLRFVDDVEFQRRPAQGHIAVRSASRIGYSDLGTNRRRIEAIRKALAGALAR
ncbi:MAG: DUF1499 domain-containing protein [Pseudomonadales bacterium]